MPLFSATMNVMQTAAKKAARGLVRDFGEVEHLQVSVKGTSDFVSAADFKSEKSLVEQLEKARPDWGFLLEEGGVREGRDPTHRWIIDPLDGTINFLHGIPHFSISVALEKEGEIVAGLVYQPLTDEMFWAEKGGGAYLNSRRLRVSARIRMDESVFTTGIPHRGRPNHALFLKQMEAVMAETAGVRRFGSAALDLAYVAAGRCDGFWEMGLSPWDMAAGLLIVREAGGYVTDLNGGHSMLESGEVVAANDRLHRKFRDLLCAAA